MSHGKQAFVGYLAMAKRTGGKRKLGPREPNGRLQRPTIEKLNEISRAQADEETKLVRMQPHRRGSAKPECATALGRFWLGLDTDDRTLLNAGEAYAGLVRRWRAAWGAKEAAVASEGLTTGEGPSAATVRGWRAQIDAIEDKLSRASHQIRWAVARLALDDCDLIDRKAKLDAQIGLRVIAIELGMASAKDHPFR